MGRGLGWVGVGGAGSTWDTPVDSREEAKDACVKSKDTSLFFNEVKILEVRKQFISLILEGNAPALEVLIQMYKKPMGQPQPPSAQSSISASSKYAHQLCMAGPCPGFQYLRVFAAIRGSCKFDTCTSTDEVKVVRMRDK